MIFDENIMLAERWVDADGEAVVVAAHVSELALIIVLKAIFGADYQELINDGEHPFQLPTDETERNLKSAARFRRLIHVVAGLVDRRLQARQDGFDFLGHLLAARTRDGQRMSTLNWSMKS